MASPQTQRPPGGQDTHEAAGSDDENSSDSNRNDDNDASSSASTRDKRSATTSLDHDDADADTTHANAQRSNKKKRKMGGRKSNVVDPRLGGSTTVEDLSAVDADAYIAWVGRQADLLPDVFVAGEGAGGEPSEGANGDGDNGGTSDGKLGAREEGAIHGSAATLQVMLSDRMSIYPPPSEGHLPPHSGDDGHPSSVEGEENRSVPRAESSGAAPSSPRHGWVAATVSNFSKLRMYLERTHAERKRRPADRKVAVPRMKDRAAWHVFCLGKEEAYGNAGGYYEEDSEEEGVAHGSRGEANGGDGGVDGAGEGPRGSSEHDPTERGAQTHPNRSNESNTTAKLVYDPASVPAGGHPPTTSLLLQLDQVLTRRLFHHHVHYLCEWKFPLSPARGWWIYALLARMEKPWHREECCAVRGVLRECCARRRGLALPEGADGKSTADADGSVGASAIDGGGSKAREQLAILNTLIAVTGIYYEQGSFAGGDGMDSLFSVAKSCSET